MKVLYHHRTQGTGAEGVHIGEIINALAKLGHQIYVVSPPGIKINHKRIAAKKNNKQKQISTFWKIVSRNLPQIIFEVLEILYNLNAIFSISSILRKQQIALIYERSAFFCFSGTYLARKKNIPIILEVNEVVGLERVRGQLLVGIAKNIEKKNFKAADAIVVVSEFLKKHIVSLGIAPEKIFVIANGVDIDKFNPGVPLQALEFENEAVVVGFVGSLVKWHNFELLLTVMKELIDEEKANIHLLLIGDGPYRKEIENFIEYSMLSRYVTLTGDIPHNLVPQYIQSMTICLIPHSNLYRSPIKLFEYMAMAKPVIAPRIKPIQAVIKDGINGALFMTGDKNSFKNVLSDLIRNRERREKMGIAARESIVKNYTWDNNAKTVISIYEKIKNQILPNE